MSGAPTSGADPPGAATPDAAALAAAGWSEAELTWEHIQVAAAEVLAEGKPAEAAQFWETGLNLARETFDENDPRLAASLANHAAGRRLAGRDGVAALLEEARQVWGRAGPWLEALKPERRARSSLFHLRMQAKHKGGYDRHSRQRYQKLAEEGRARIEALTAGRDQATIDLERWKRERPPGFSDARRLLAAVVLIAG